MKFSATLSLFLLQLEIISTATGTAFLTTNSSTCRTMAEGDPLSLRCTVRHTYIGRYNIEWFRANSHSGCCARRTSDSSFWSIPKERTVKTFRQDEKSVEVIIPRFTNKHEGVYFCRLTSILNDEKQVSEPIEVRLSKNVQLGSWIQWCRASSSNCSQPLPNGSMCASVRTPPPPTCSAPKPANIIFKAPFMQGMTYLSLQWANLKNECSFDEFTWRYRTCNFSLDDPPQLRQLDERSNHTAVTCSSPWRLLRGKRTLLPILLLDGYMVVQLERVSTVTGQTRVFTSATHIPKFCPPVITSSNSLMTVCRGEEAILNLEVSGYPSPTVSLSKVLQSSSPRTATPPSHPTKGHCSVSSDSLENYSISVATETSSTYVGIASTKYFDKSSGFVTENSFAYIKVVAINCNAPQNLKGDFGDSS